MRLVVSTWEKDLTLLNDYREQFDILWEVEGFKTKFLILNEFEWSLLVEKTICLVSHLQKMSYQYDLDILDYYRFKKLDPSFVEFLLMCFPEDEIIQTILDTYDDITDVDPLGFVIYLIQYWMTADFYEFYYQKICEDIKEDILNHLTYITSYWNLSDYNLIKITINKFVDYIREVGV